MSRFRVYKCFSIVLVLLGVLGCVPHKEGPAQLKYVKTSETVGEFELNNQTAQSIEFLGERGLSMEVDVHRAEYSLTCKNASGTEIEGIGSADPPSFAKIAPGEQVRINVHTALIYRSKGGRCRLKLPLISGPSETVESAEFAP